MSNGIDESNCPARQGYLPNDASGCHCYYVNQDKGIVDVSAATPYNTTYYKEWAIAAMGGLREEILMFFREDFPQIKEDGGIGILQIQKCIGPLV